MAVKILIRRTFGNADKKDIMAMLIKARSNAMGMKGYISTETLVSVEDPHSYLMLSMWQTKEDWEAYKTSPARQQFEKESAKLLEKETQYEVFNMGM